MAMTPGSVSISASGVATKSGFAGTRYDAMVASWAAKLLAFGQLPPTAPAELVPVLKSFAEQANEQAALITYIQANGTAGGDPIL